MIIRIPSSIALGALLCLTCVLPASGAGAATPPNDSSIDQYLPSVPGAGGDQSVDGGGGDGGDGGNGGGSEDGGGSSLPPETESELEQQGPTGAAVAGLVEETAPAAPDSTGSDSNTDQQGGGGAQGDGGSGAQGNGGGGAQGDGGAAKADEDETGFLSKLGKLVSASVASEGGMGIGLPIILLASLIAALVVLVLRRRGAGTGS